MDPRYGENPRGLARVRRCSDRDRGAREQNSEEGAAATARGGARKGTRTASSSTPVTWIGGGDG